MNIQNIEKKEKNMATFEVKVPADVFDNAVTYPFVLRFPFPKGTTTAIPASTSCSSRSGIRY